jgi:hypothetical protein
MLIILASTGLFTEFVLVGQTVSSATTVSSRRLSENVGRLRRELWRQKNWMLHHDNAPSHTSSFAREFLTKSNMTVVLDPQYFSVSPIEENAERPPF